MGSFRGYRWADPAGFNITTGWHYFGTLEFDLKDVMAFSNNEKDGCTIDKIIHEQRDWRYFTVYIKDLNRSSMMQDVKYQFHIIYSTGDGKLYKQTIKNDGRKIEILSPIEIHLDDYSVSGKYSYK